MGAVVKWFSGRSPREQALLGLLGALLVGTVGWYGVANPLLNWRQAAAERRAHAELAAVQAIQDANLVAGARTGRAAIAPDALPALLTATAAEAGVTVTREQPEGGGAHTVWLEGARPAAVFGWLAEVERRGGVVRDVTALKSGGGVLDVQATLEPGQ